MDAMGDLLRGIRANGATMCRSIAAPPWRLEFDASAPLTLMTPVVGDAWLIPTGETSMRLRTSDIGIVRGNRGFVVADDPATEVGVIYHGGDRYSGEATHDGGRTWRLNQQPAGNPAEMVLLTGSYQVHGDISDRLLSALPEAFVVSNTDGSCPVLELLSTELGRERPGQDIVLDRMLDVILVYALRDWFDRPEAEPPAWYVALGDPVVGPALRALHDDPGAAWTVDALARHAGVSRAGFARRFRELVGEPPLNYLTSWRMALAADLLRSSGTSISAVARQVGYGDRFAFSTAFKRVRGIRPSEHRAVG